MVEATPHLNPFDMRVITPSTPVFVVGSDADTVMQCVDDIIDRLPWVTNEVGPRADIVRAVWEGGHPVEGIWGHIDFETGADDNAVARVRYCDYLALRAGGSADEYVCFFAGEIPSYTSGVLAPWRMGCFPLSRAALGDLTSRGEIVALDAKTGVFSVFDKAMYIKGAGVRRATR